MLSTQSLDRDAQLSSGERQLKSFGGFLDVHDNLLNRLSSQLSGEDDYFGCNLDKVIAETSTKCPVKLDYCPPREQISIFQIIESDNKTLNKILLTFVHLADEAFELKAEAQMYQMKLLYSDEDLCASEESGQSGECFIKMSNLLELLNTIHHLTQRCIMLASAVVQQLAALFTNEDINSKLDLQLAMQFQVIFNRLADVIVQLIVFDEILLSSNLQKFWQSYKKTIHSISKNLSKFHPYNEFEMIGLTNVLNYLEILFAGQLFQTFLDSTFKIKEEISTKVLAVIASHFQEYIRVNLASIERFSSNISEFDETEMIIKMNAVCVLYHNFFGHLDQKLFKNLIDLNSKNIAISLIGNMTWHPEPFLKKHAETLMKSFDKYFIESTRVHQTYLHGKIQTLLLEAKQYCALITLWSLQMNATLKIEAHNLKINHFKNLCNLFLEGLKYAGQLTHMLKSVTNLHVWLRTKMSKNTLLVLCKLIEDLTIVQSTFQCDFVNISKSIQCVIQYLTYKILSAVSVTKNKLSGQGRNERNLDTVSALQIAEKCMHGTATNSRMLITSLALNSANPTHTLSLESLQKLHKVLHRLDSLVNLELNVEKLCNASFTYWHQSILTVYLKQMIGRHSTEHTSVKFLINSADSCSRNLEKIGITDLRMIENFRRSIYKQYRHEIVEKLYAQIETFLRIEVHANLSEEKKNLGSQFIQEYRDLVNICPIEIGGRHVILKDQVEDYLSNMFYNLTTISLHDWKTYGKMRYLGNYKFNIISIEDHLPTQTLEQGIDVLEIMRNIHVFVSTYLYNMNNQIFIERASNNKHLNTIGIKHVANSLRTHGTGIINTTVNFTYQFLRKKFYSFSQFMYDEHIKSRLMKDFRYFRVNKERLSQMYSYERADSFNKGIRKFGLTTDGQSYLDLFRQLISHIGNAVGYIRLIRSGGIHSSSNISVYLPKFNENLKFSKTAIIDNLFVTSIIAAKNFESNIRNLSRSVSEGTDYFQLLVDAFAPFFRNPTNIHLRNFYLIIPPLTINFVEYIMNAKEKIHKKNKHGVLFIDDGFAIGLAYILKLLNQMSEFNSLHWFKAVKEKYTAEIMKINAQREHIAGGASGDDKLHQTLSLSEKRINAYQIEFNLLYYNLTSSKILFQ